MDFYNGKFLWYSIAIVAFPEGEAKKTLQSPLHQESQVPKKDGYVGGGLSLT